LRGITIKPLAFFEECDFIPLHVLIKLFAPLFEVKDTVVGVISTFDSDSRKNGEASGFEQIVNSPAFAKVELKLICDECLAIGICDPCKHNRGFRPAWFTKDDNDDLENYEKDENDPMSELNTNPLKMLYGNTDKEKDIKMRELYGVHKKNEEMNGCFSKDLIRGLVTEPRKQFDRPVRNVKVSIDPCAGTNTNNPDHRLSDYVIVTGCDEGILIGIDSIASNDIDVIDDVILKHLKRVREIDECKTCNFLVDIEAGNATEPARVLRLIQSNFANIVPIRDFEFKKGTNTNNKHKQLMLANAKQLLRNGSLRISNQFVCVTESVESVLAKFQNQMTQLEMYPIPSKSINQKVTYAITGKGKNKDQKDDISITFLRMLYVSIKWLDSKYDSFRI